MASSTEYLEFILEQLCGLENIAYRAMMGEYIIYYRGKVIGGHVTIDGRQESSGLRILLQVLKTEGGNQDLSL